MERFLTQNEVCKILKVSRPTLLKLIREGKIKTIKYGSVIRIPASQFDEKED